MRLRKQYIRELGVHGIGTNDADYQVYTEEYKCPFYRKWEGIIKRCSEGHQKRYPSYKGCTLSPKWTSFLSFKGWMIEQDWEGKEIDKDLLVFGNRIYGPEFCCFISHQINNTINHTRSKSSNLPQGIIRCLTTGRLRVSINIDGKRTNLGRFESNEVDIAEMVYLKAKSKLIREYADLENNQKIRRALYIKADFFENKDVYG